MKKFTKLTSAVLLIVLVLSLVACGGSEDADDPRLGVWTGTEASAYGMTIAVDSAFAGGISIELKAKGKCVINVGEESAKGTWSEENGVFTAEGGGVTLSGTMTGDTFVAENVLDSGISITFVKDAPAA